MNKSTISTIVNLQLFADGGDGAATTGDTGTNGVVEATGVTSGVPDLKLKAEEKNPLANVKYGIQEGDNSQSSVATNKNETDTKKPTDNNIDKKAEFKKLIKGEYKDLYDERVKDTVTKRLKTSKEAEDKFNSLAPMFELLAKKYGVEATDIKGLMKAVEDDDAYYENEALERGLTVDQLREIKKIERENAELKKQSADDNAKKIYAEWLTQAETAKQKYPSLDLSEEIKNKDFAELLRCGIDVDTAYTVIHKDEIMSAGMQYAAKKTEEKLANNVLANRARPTENGINSQASAVIKSDVSKLTKEDRAEIIRRVSRGEKIKF